MEYAEKVRRCRDYTTCFNKGIRSAVAFLKRNGCTPVKGHYSQGYHYCSGFFYAPNGNLWYFMTADDRMAKKSGEPMANRDMPLFRTARDLNDYTGGPNGYVKNAVQFRSLVGAEI